MTKTNADMNIISLHQYMRTSVGNKDGHALEVLYFTAREAVERQDFTLYGPEGLDIDEKYHPGPVHVELQNEFYPAKKCIALLLSIKAVILHPGLIGYCKTEQLIFNDLCQRPFEWIKYFQILSVCQTDNDFRILYKMLEDLEYNGCISIALKEIFHANTKIPQCKITDDTDKETGGDKKEDKPQIIGDNSFLGNDSVTDLTVPESVEYVGNTAFAYCANLQTITFTRNDTVFGIFPIIECPLLKRIIVPEGSEKYYKDCLPYYGNIIFVKSPSSNNGTSETDVAKTQTDEYDPYVYQSVSNRKDSQQGNGTDDNRTAANGKKMEAFFSDKPSVCDILWLLAILEITKEKAVLTIPFREIISKILALAWPLVKNHISLGTKNCLDDIFLHLKSILKIHINTDSLQIEKRVYDNYNTRKTKNILSSLIQDLPYSFLSPWIGHASNNEVRFLSQDPDCTAPYALYDEYIVLDETWYEYFIGNYNDIHSSATSSLLDQLKSFNNGLSLLRFMIEAKNETVPDRS